MPPRRHDPYATFAPPTVPLDTTTMGSGRTRDWPAAPAVDTVELPSSGVPSPHQRSSSNSSADGTHLSHRHEIDSSTYDSANKHSSARRDSAMMNGNRREDAGDHAPSLMAGSGAHTPVGYADDIAHPHGYDHVRYHSSYRYQQQHQPSLDAASWGATATNSDTFDHTSPLVDGA
eukprot:CAMPEP_0174840006 /NCGR_PEP_ID=MMETSP1114-20130205/8410_1 /TAXON_ID=312471 /ORGANISM="Neobodo designis, Strain CCAP 1951/1" /LENGTH=174 /DNA_ID=CAMNT_0016074135 /DNA_START=896 /DNA_END=1416 /DNA_ORIENTATION=-